MAGEDLSVPPVVIDGPLIVGVVSDTHIPDWAENLHPHLIPALKDAGVSLILHGGDISSPAVLDTLAAVAPVIAVRGNRDFVFLNSLPLFLRLEIGGVSLALMHGHGGLMRYLLDKVSYIRHGYSLQRHMPVLFQTAPEAQVVVFGHTHYAENLYVNGKLLFNPGSATRGPRNGLPISYGLLYFDGSGGVRAEIKQLHDMRRDGRKWIADGTHLRSDY